MQPQSSLGTQQVYRLPSFNGAFLGRVTSTQDFDLGRVEVVLLNGGTPTVAWVVGDIARKPVAGDQVLVSYIEGRPDTPFILGFVHKAAYSSDSIRVEKDRIVLKVGAGSITLTESGIEIYHPDGVTLRSDSTSTTI